MSLKKQYQMLCTALLKEKIDCVPPGWQTAEKIAEENNKSISQISKVLKNGVKLKKVETRKFKISAGSRVMPVAHYRFL